MPGSPSLTRAVYAAALVIAPTLLLGALLVDITPQADDTGELLGLIAERPAMWSTGQMLFFLSAIAWVPAGLALIRLFGPRAKAGRLGGAAVLLGGLAILPVDAAGLYLSKLATSGVPLEEQVAVVEGVEGSVAVIVFEAVHVIGLFIGMLVVAVALLRRRTVPVWVPAALILAFVGLLAAPNRVVEMSAMGLMVLGLGMAGARLLRMSDHEWREGASCGREERDGSLPALARVALTGRGDLLE